MSPRAACLSLSLLAGACTQTPSADEPEPSGADGGVILSELDATAPLPDGAEAADACPTPPLGAISGSALERHNGSNGYDATSADVTWTRVASAACVDRYQPSGTVRYVLAGFGCSQVVTPGSGPIEPGDGELIVDRNAVPATYRMSGSSRFDASVHCTGDAAGPLEDVGGRWAAHQGALVGGLLAGGVVDETAAGHVVRWRFVSAAATFTPPSDCSEPAVDQWTTVTLARHHRATAAWTRTDTTGCVDTFAPRGTVVALPFTTSTCAEVAFEPGGAAIAAGDGTLTIDRSTDPATFRIEGATTWPATFYCTHSDGTVATEPMSAGGTWATFTAEYDGDRFSGGFDDTTWGPTTWSFERD